MRIVFNVLIIIFTTFLVLSCNQDDPRLGGYSKIDGIVNNGDTYNNKIDSVYGIIYYDQIDIKLEKIAKSVFQNGRFYLNLPPLPEDRLFFTIDNRFPKSLISDTTVKINFLTLQCISMGYRIGEMYLHNSVNRYDSGFMECEYIYCNNPVRVKGIIQKKSNPYIVTSIYDLKFKKGWNVLTRSTSDQNFESKIYYTSNVLPSEVKWYPNIMLVHELIRQK